MNLDELIKALQHEPADKIIREGFHRPHSYRGHYDQLAFEPLMNARVGDMLEAAQGSLGRVFIGYKGGDFMMGPYTGCNLAHYGSCGDELSERLLRYMLADEVTA
ncbi:hypothetical protein [Lysobacter capsici]|uniref:hypothetical protein n=1 Tax=Lysobacter capsici TaxID=435897 RepID=UPI00287BBE01|nr:hypothetical protein [Lysobacter capsici]WND79434.1 hypothetical protein RJ610_19335 [Lysobacter capsici]WND84630.1 hypothetical protein RJ609_19350 [Lysobacter capsici]